MKDNLYTRYVLTEKQIKVEDFMYYCSHRQRLHFLKTYQDVEIDCSISDIHYATLKALIEIKFK